VQPVWANAAGLLLTFGTGLFHYGTYDASFSHIYSALLVSLLVWLTARAAGQGQPLPLVPVVIAAALLFLVRTTSGLLVASWVAACFLPYPELRDRSPKLRFRAALGAGLGLALGAAVTFAINYAMFQRLTLHTYTGESFVWHESNMRRVLGGQLWGVFRIYPMLGIALIAGFVAKPTRYAALWLAGIVAAYTFVYGHWWTWHLSYGFGHRGFVEMIPFAIPVFAVALNALPRATVGSLAALGGIATAYTLHQMLRYWDDQPFRRIGLWDGFWDLLMP
jgi:hypothetical protein